MSKYSLLVLVVFGVFAGCVNKKTKIYIQKEWFMAGFMGQRDAAGKLKITNIDSAVRVRMNFAAWKKLKNGAVDSVNAEAVVDTTVVWYFRYSGDTVRDRSNKPVYDSAKKQYRLLRAFSQPIPDSLVKPIVDYGPADTVK